MPATTIPGRQVRDSDIGREDLNTANTGRAVATKIVQGTGMYITSTGADAGTGDVTINANTSLLALTDVNAGNPGNGQVLTYSTASSKWEAADPTGGGGGVGSAIPQIVDTIASQFNNAQTVFTIAVSGTNVSPGAPQNLFLSINGVLQQPNTDYTVSGSTITFAVAPKTGSTFFATCLNVVSVNGAFTIQSANGTTQSTLSVTDGNTPTSRKLQLISPTSGNGAHIWTKDTTVSLFLGGNAIDLLELRPSDNSARFTGSVTERGRATPMGEWTTPAYSSGNFAGYGAMTWVVDSGDVLAYAYTLLGKTLFFRFHINTSRMGGTASTLVYMTIPGGFTAASRATGMFHISENGTRYGGIAQVANSGTTVALYKFTAGGALTNYAAANTDTVEIQGQIFLEIQ